MSVSTEILIVGAGVLGLCTAAELRRRGHEVVVLDPGRPNASSVAAGMIAPALEAALDDATLERAALLREARLAWDGFAEEFGLDLRPGPAIWRGGDSDAVAERLTALGFAYERTGQDLRVADDAQIDATAAMARLRFELGAALRIGEAEAIARGTDRWSVRTSDGVIEAEVVVLATGVGTALPGLADADVGRLKLIQPIRGQIGRTGVALTAGVVRGPDVYLALAEGGSVIGATMEPDRRDLIPDDQTGRRLIQAASALRGEPVTAPVEWRVGVRGATPDGLPMAGAGSVPGLYLALAPRRNGWLLGPLVAGTVADAIEGVTPGPHASALDPARF